MVATNFKERMSEPVRVTATNGAHTEKKNNRNYVKRYTAKLELEVMLDVSSSFTNERELKS